MDRLILLNEDYGAKRWVNLKYLRAARLNDGNLFLSLDNEDIPIFAADKERVLKILNDEVERCSQVT